MTARFQGGKGPAWAINDPAWSAYRTLGTKSAEAQAPLAFLRWAFALACALSKPS